MRPTIPHMAFVTLALWAMPGAPVAQTTPASTPNFSGVWTMDKNRSELAAQEEPAGDIIFTIAQTGSILQVETLRDGKKDVAIYPIGPRPVATTEGSAARGA